MKITHIQSTLVPVWRNGRTIKWVSPEQAERVWHEQQMIKRFGRTWDDTED